MSELQHYEPSLLVPATDSWTAVVEQVGDLANKIAGTDFVPVSYRNKPAQIAAAILHGRELGLGPMSALAATHVINGKPAISAEAMRSLTLQAGHEIAFTETTGSRCKIRGRRHGQDEWTEVTWTLEDARRAGLDRNQTYKNYPRQMLAARATAELCRMIFADAIHGMHAIEELDDVSIPQPNGATPPPPKEPPTTVRRQPRKPAPEAIEAAPETPAEPPAPTERKRATIPRRGAEEPPPEPAQAAHTRLGPRQEPTPHHNVTTASPVKIEAVQTNTEPADKGQIAAIQMHTQRLGIAKDEQEFRHTIVATLAGLDKLESTNDLTHHQATLVINQLGKLRDREALEEHLNQLPPF